MKALTLISYLPLVAFALLFNGCSFLQRDKGLCECECKANCIDVEFKEGNKDGL